MFDKSKIPEFLLGLDYFLCMYFLSGWQCTMGFDPTICWHCLYSCYVLCPLCIILNRVLNSTDSNILPYGATAFYWGFCRTNSLELPHSWGAELVISCFLTNLWSLLNLLKCVLVFTCSPSHLMCHLISLIKQSLIYKFK